MSMVEVYFNLVCIEARSTLNTWNRLTNGDRGPGSPFYLWFPIPDIMKSQFMRVSGHVLYELLLCPLCIVLNVRLSLLPPATEYWWAVVLGKLELRHSFYYRVEHSMNSCPTSGPVWYSIFLDAAIKWFVMSLLVDVQFIRLFLLLHLSPHQEEFLSKLVQYRPFLS